MKDLLIRNTPREVARISALAVLAAFFTVRYMLVAAAFTAVMFGDDITVPLDDGNILISAQFIRVNEYGNYIPELTLKLKNQTSAAWQTLKLQLDISGVCNGNPHQWTLPVVTDLGWDKDHQFVKEYTDRVIPLFGKVDGCTTENIKVRLLFAENSNTRIDGVTGDRIDLKKQRQELLAKREAEAAAQAEVDRKAAEAQAKKDAAEAAAQAKKDAAEAARRKQLAAEQKRKQAEADAQQAKMKAEADAKAAEERRKVRAACAVVYQNTIDKKIKDLTVREEQQVRACQELGLYPPQ